MTIRWAYAEDAHTLARVHVASWHTAYRGMVADSVLKDFTMDKWQDHFQKAIIEKTEDIAVIEEHGKVLGYTIIGPSRDDDTDVRNCGEIWGLYISPEHWRKGLGSRLTEWALNELLSRGYETVNLWVFKGNKDNYSPPPGLPLRSPSAREGEEKHAWAPRQEFSSPGASGAKAPEAPREARRGY